MEAFYLLSVQNDLQDSVWIATEIAGIEVGIVQPTGAEDAERGVSLGQFAKSDIVFGVDRPGLACSGGDNFHSVAGHGIQFFEEIYVLFRAGFQIAEKALYTVVDVAYDGLVDRLVDSIVSRFI